ncbi:glycosyltransferase [Candidatus Lokiarchaeum ossiferum]|uniref:glycosyltransferase n=1 Tax=Candidatus Lokiarchaeum ossiferum TaxID=2951803 RepID=UPI00352F76A8
MRFLIIQETDWEERGPHQQHHLMERLASENHEIRVIDYEFLWYQKNKLNLYTKQKKIKSSPKIINSSNIKIIRPASLNVPILSYLSIPFFHFPVLFKEIKNFKPDYIFGFGIFTSFIGLILGKLFNIPFYYYIIDHLHTLVPLKIFQPLSKLFESINIKFCDKLFAINKGLVDYAEELGGDKKKCVIIPGGVDLEKYKINNLIREKMRKSLEIFPNEIVLMFMGWIYDFSGLKEITDYLVENQTKTENIRLLVVGEGDLFNYINSRRNELKNSNQIILTGKVPFHLIPEYLQAADFCILPAYKNEIMNNIVPIKLYEYIAAGNPVIATKLDGVFKEFGRNNGILYIDKPEEVFEKIRINKDVYRSIVNQGQKFIQNYDWDEIVINFKKSLVK